MKWTMFITGMVISLWMVSIIESGVRNGFTNTVIYTAGLLIGAALMVVPFIVK